MSMLTDLHFSEQQKTAVAMCADTMHRIVCVTGPAGTGKTTILRAAVDEMRSDNPLLEIALCAPTGRAAKRIEEATGLEARTIHRLLRFTSPLEDGDRTYPQHSKTDPMPYDVIFVDESSMIDPDLWRVLIDAMRPGSLIRFFGDINQLPPVQGTSPFAEALKKFPSTFLTENYRSGDGIVTVANRIIEGKMPIANDRVKMLRIKSNEVFNSLRTVCDEEDFTSLDMQIIAPTQRTKYGTEAINVFMQQRYNRAVDKINTYPRDSYGETVVRSFKIGDKVLFGKNDYTLEVMNGSIGRVLAFDTEVGNITVDFDGRGVVDIPPVIEAYHPVTQEKIRYDPRNSLTLGYAITTHKAQGSQFSVVLYVITRSRAATRQNFYTAATRAKNKLVVVNVGGALMDCLNTRA